MNRQLGRIGAAIVPVTVFLFAVCLMTDFTFGSYFVCMSPFPEKACRGLRGREVYTLFTHRTPPMAYNGGGRRSGREAP